MICHICEENYPDSQIAYLDYGIEPEPTTGEAFQIVLSICVHCLGFRCRGESMVSYWREFKQTYHFLESIRYNIQQGIARDNERYTKGQGVYYYWDPADFRRRNG